MSDRRDWSSQSETVRRKLSIMIPIPIVVDTATTRAAAATPVRLIDAGMLRAAIVPCVRTRRPGPAGPPGPAAWSRPARGARTPRRWRTVRRRTGGCSGRDRAAPRRPAGSGRPPPPKSPGGSSGCLSRWRNVASRPGRRGGRLVRGSQGRRDRAEGPQPDRLDEHHRRQRNLPDGEGEVQVPIERVTISRRNLPRRYPREARGPFPPRRGPPLRTGPARTPPPS